MEDSPVGSLDSEDPREVSWAAYRAGKGYHTDLVPAIRGTLRVWAHQDGQEADIVCRFLLDALVDLNADVPAGELVPHLIRPRIHSALVLLARGGWYRDRALLELFGSDQAARSHGVWLAAGNLLADRRIQGFAVQVLGDLEFELAVRVLDSDSAFDGGGWSSGVGIGCYARIKGRPWVGYPPFPTYHLSRKQDGVLLAPGTQPVYYERTYQEGDPRMVSRTLSRPWEQGLAEIRRSWIRKISGEEYVPSLRTTRVVDYRDDAHFLREVADFQADLEKSYDGLIEALIGQGVLSRFESVSVPLTLHTEVIDRRERRQRPLPTLPERR